MASNINRWQTDIIKAFAPMIISRLREMADKKELSSAARVMNIQVSRLSEMASGDRKISAHYLGKLFKGGFITLEHILQGRKLEDLTDDEQEVLFTLRMKKSLTRLLMEYEKRNMDAEAILTAVLPKD